MVIGITGSLLFKQAISSNKNYFKSSTLVANNTCTVDGRSYGSYNFSFNATELTSGVDYWQCHNATSGYWTTCPNSNGCITYKINADSGYDQIKTYDIAGNVSSIRYLYKKDIEQISGMQDSTYVNDSGRGKGKVKIINNYYQREGTISNVSINNEKISVTGRTEDCEKIVYYNATRDYKKVCKLGTYNADTGKCEAESYRLQNDTCYCTMKLDNGKLKIAWPEDPGQCARHYTYCTDKFKSSDNDQTKYEKVTLSNTDDNVGDVCTRADGWGSSCDFQRPESSACTTHYNSIVNVLSDSVTTYADYQNKIATGNRSVSTMSAVASFATAGNPCENSGNVEASYNFNDVCKSLESKSSSIAVKTTDDYYVVPVVMSAACNWVEKAPDKTNPNYGKYIQNF